MSFKTYWPAIQRAVHSAHLEAGRPRAIGSDVWLAWLENHEPDVIEELRGAGYLDADDPVRIAGKAPKKWSWRQYLANAASRLARQGGVLLMDDPSPYVPEGYFAPVGMWRPVAHRDPATGDAEDDDPSPMLNVRLSSARRASLDAMAKAHGLSLGALVESALAPAYGFDLPVPSSLDTLLDCLERDLAEAIGNEGWSLPLGQRVVEGDRRVAQGEVIRLSMRLTFSLADHLDLPETAWSVCASRGALGRTDDICPNGHEVVKRWGYEEGNDIVVFTQRGEKAWPVVATESEAGHWHEVGVDTDRHNDYAWDFYKLLSSKAFAVLFVGVLSRDSEDGVPGRMRRLADSLEEYHRRYSHLRAIGQPTLVVLLPRHDHEQALLGAALRPGEFVWRWASVSPLRVASDP